MKRSNLKNCTVKVSKKGSLDYPVIIQDESGKFLAGVHISSNTTEKFKMALADAIRGAAL